MIITNYAYLIAQNKYGTGIGAIDHLILDEAHEAHGAICDALNVHLNDDDMGLIKQHFPVQDTSLSEWRAWAKRIIPSINIELGMWELRIQREPKPSWIKQYNRLFNIQRKLATLATMNPAAWVVEKGDTGYDVDPIRIGGYAERLLFKGAKKVTLLSATIRPKTLAMCGIRPDDSTFFEYRSSFPVEYRPIYYIPTTNVNFNSSPDDIRQWVTRHDQIFSRRLDRKHLVHTGSYQRREDLTLKSTFKRYMHYNLRGDVTDDLVNRFRQMSPPAILVSPSISTGYDFAGKDAQCQIIDKVPFPPKNKKVIEARQAADKEYGVYHAIQGLSQAAGRINRSKDDKGETFIIDDNIQWLTTRYRYLFPRSFMEAYSPETTIPKPLEL